ncbi:hypothetical protein [Bradyrhizobium sp. SRS-191]|uniref:hypothetical protein n=1 Tax=Bradyrhizobium sp. SRS-191 TaxID=2962606 RepID=UPI00211E1680|nr:hypothetical protein [Bradyrhizobium sp. SRS-191]
MTITGISETMPGRSATRPGRWLFMAMLALIMLVGSLPVRPAAASGALIAASNEAVGGLNACSSNKGKDLYNCVADVLDRLNSRIASINVPETHRALQAASEGLRAATSRPQAISALSRCKAAISAVIQRLRASGGEYAGLSAISGVLSRAIQLVQSKG